MKIDINKIIPDPNQPRKTFDDEHIGNISNSINKYGFISRIVVRPYDDKYMIVVGENRWKAAKKSGLEEIECEIREADEKESREMQFIENYHRKDVPLWEQWEAWDKYIKENKITDREFSRISGIPHITVQRGLEVLKNLAPGGQKYFKEGRLAHRVAREAVRIKGKDRQNEITELFVKDNGTEPVPSDYAPAIVSMALEEPNVPARDIERCVRLGVPHPPIKKERKSTLDLTEIVKHITSQFAKLDTLLSGKKIDGKLLTNHALDIYSWRDTINQLIKIMEVQDAEKK